MLPTTLRSSPLSPVIAPTNDDAVAPSSLPMLNHRIWNSGAGPSTTRGASAGAADCVASGASVWIGTTGDSIAAVAASARFTSFGCAVVTPMRSALAVSRSRSSRRSAAAAISSASLSSSSGSSAASSRALTPSARILRSSPMRAPSRPTACAMVSGSTKYVSAPPVSSDRRCATWRGVTSAMTCTGCPPSDESSAARVAGTSYSTRSTLCASTAPPVAFTSPFNVSYPSARSAACASATCSASGATTIADGAFTASSTRRNAAVRVALLTSTYCRLSGALPSATTSSPTRRGRFMYDLANNVTSSVSAAIVTVRAMSFGSSVISAVIDASSVSASVRSACSTYSCETTSSFSRPLGNSAARSDGAPISAAGGRAIRRVPRAAEVTGTSTGAASPDGRTAWATASAVSASGTRTSRCTPASPAVRRSSAGWTRETIAATVGGAVSTTWLLRVTLGTCGMAVSALGTMASKVFREKNQMPAVRRVGARNGAGMSNIELRLDPSGGRARRRNFARLSQPTGAPLPPDSGGLAYGSPARYPEIVRRPN